MIEIGMAALAGAGWRWWDGRGYGPGWARLAVCAALALILARDVGWWALAVAVPFTALWTPRQKNREEWDDMAFRWAVPVGAVFGFGLSYLAGGWAPLWIMGGGGLLVTTLVWVGVHKPWLKVGNQDSTAVTEALAGAVAFGCLAWAV